VLFSSAYSSTHPSQTNIRWCVADCAIYTAWSSVNVFGTSQVQESSIARPESRFVPIPHLHSTPPLGGGGSGRNIATPFLMEKLEWCPAILVEKISKMFYSFWHDPRTWQMDTAWRHTPRLYMHSIARQLHRPSIIGRTCHFRWCTALLSSFVNRALGSCKARRSKIDLLA